jgi:hypothetical protein
MLTISHKKASLLMGFSHSIEQEINQYFRNDAAIDLNTSKDSFPRFCVSRIWISVCKYQNPFCTYSPPADKHIEDLFEILKEITGVEKLHIEEISTNPNILRLKLKNGIWYIYHWTGYYYVIPEWEGPRVWPKNLKTDEEARLILAFDEYIPQIQARAQELLLKHKEEETACEIIKASAEGLINTLLSEGRISLRRKADIYCPALNRIEVILDDSTKWLCLSLDELKGLLLRRYGTK